jgi:hypothetical protein
MMLNEGRRLSYWDPLDMGIGIFHVVVVVVPSLGTQFLISRRSLIVGQTDTRSRYPSQCHRRCDPLLVTKILWNSVIFRISGQGQEALLTHLLRLRAKAQQTTEFAMALSDTVR